MCYGWHNWKSKTEKAEKREQPQTVTERKPAASQPEPIPVNKKPQKVETELETI